MLATRLSSAISGLTVYIALEHCGEVRLHYNQVEYHGIPRSRRGTVDPRSHQTLVAVSRKLFL